MLDMGEDLLLIPSFGVLHTVQLSQDITSERDSAALRANLSPNRANPPRFRRM